MDKTKHEVIIQDRIAREMEALFPLGEGRASSARVKRSLESVAAVAFREGQSYALSSLMTIDDVARELGVSPRRAKAIAREMHDRYGVGWLAPAGGGGVWLFRPDEIEILRPGPGGRRKADCMPSTRNTRLHGGAGSPWPRRPMRHRASYGPRSRGGLGKDARRSGRV